MQFLQLFVTLIGHIAWPVALLIVVLVFRRPLLDHLPTLVSIRGGGFEAQFAAQRDSVEDNIQEAVLALAEDSLATRQAHSEDGTDGSSVEARGFTGEAAEALAIINSSWGAVSTRIDELLTRAEVSEKHIPVFVKLRMLREKGFLTEAETDSVQGLNEMRNLAVHSPAGELNMRKSKEFLALASAQMYLLDRAIRRQATN